jgi:hypothetical protein
MDVIIISGVVATGTTMIRRYSKKEKFYFQTLMYGTIVTFILLVMAMPLPAVAKGLAYLMMVGAFAVNGPELFKIVGRW